VSEPSGLAPKLDLQANDFVLFGLEPGFTLDRQAVDARWKQLQREVHPDRFAAQGQAAQRVAMQWSVRINEAYNRLKDPLKRAAYWCELQGAPVNAESNTAMPPAFLMQQMEWREALDDANTEDALQTLWDQTQTARSELLQDLAQSIDTERDAKKAVGQVRSLMFVERFADEVQSHLERL
jgi:molecular chaperone HscB